MKRVAADQSIIDQAIALQAQGKTDAEIARELGVGPATPSNWRKQGRLPEKPQRKTNGGKVREYEPLPKLQPGQRLDGTPEPKKEEKPRMIEVEKAQVAEEPRVFDPEAKDKARIRRSTVLEGTYLMVELRDDKASMDIMDAAIRDAVKDGLTKRQLLTLLMDIGDEIEAIINLPEMSL